MVLLFVNATQVLKRDFFYEVVIIELKQTKEAMDAISLYKHVAVLKKKKPSESLTSIHELNELLQMRNRQWNVGFSIV